MHNSRHFFKIYMGSKYSIIISVSYLILLSCSIALNAQTTFTKITTGAIVTDIAGSRGGSWGDYDNDGDLDLFVTNCCFESNFLYQNKGDPGGTGQVVFTRTTSGEIANDSGDSWGSSWGDYNNDGDLDLFVTNSQDINFLYQNNGDGTFSRITSGDIVSDGGGSAGAWGDYDNDGDLDLIIANRGLNFLYQNNGDPEGTGQVTFTRIFSGPFRGDFGNSWGCSWGDYDNDGDLDLFVANINGEDNFLYRNNGDPEGTGQVTFTRITSGDIVNDGGKSHGGSWGDYDNDGDLDLFVPNTGGENNFLYQNNDDPEGTGQVTFTRITSGEIVNDGGLSVGSNWGDYDNDGDLDLFVANRGENNFLYQNNGDPEGTGQVTFTRITAGDIVNDGTYSRGGSWGDYDNDGDLDLFVGNVGATVEQKQNNLLYKNNGSSNNWINIKCVGTFSNSSAIGARVKVKANLSGKPVQQMREISAYTGSHGHNSLNAEFGLGDAAVIDSIKIDWPSGRNQLLTDIDINQFLTVIETVPLVVQATPPVEIGTEIVVDATDTSDVISQVTLKYRRGGENTFTAISMSDQGNGSFRETIPAGEVTPSGIEYRLVATDNAGRSARLPTRFSYSVRVHVPDGISRGQAQPHGSEQTAYRIFSVSLDLDDRSPGALLEDDLGEYDDTRWRFSEYSGDNTYREFPEITEIVPGKGYWFIVSEPARVIDTGAGTSNITSEEFAITLRSGWNLIGNPFNFPIPVGNLRLQSGSLSDLRTFAGTWNNPVSDRIPRILPFEGYAVFSENATTLFINPDLSAATSSLAKTVESMSENDILWSIQIIAECQQARDVDNIAGVVLSASENWDQLDLPEPPPIGEYVSVYFPHREWGKLSKRFSTDFRPFEPPIEPAEGSEPSAGFSEKVWEFEVQTNIRDQVKLTFAGLENVPREFEVWLMDESLNLTQNLREDNHFVLAGAGEEQPKRLKLLVGKNEFIDDNLSDVQTIPTEFELSPNFPNPFNPVTTIRFGLPTAESVTLKVYNILGKEVATLLRNEKKSAGYHTAIWDGRDQQGQPVASGIYMVQLRAGDLSTTRKMALVR